MSSDIRSQLTSAKKRKIMESANNVCEIKNCKNKSYEVHHIIHVSKGGTNVGSNLIVLCANCHRDVHDGKVLQSKLKNIVSGRSKKQKSYITKILQNTRKPKEKGFFGKLNDLWEKDII